MLEYKKKFTHRILVPLPNTKQGNAGDMEDNDAVEKQVEEGLRDDTEADEAPRDQ